MWVQNFYMLFIAESVQILTSFNANKIFMTRIIHGVMDILGQIIIPVTVIIFFNLLMDLFTHLDLGNFYACIVK
jgi:hypothetical protein